MTARVIHYFDYKSPYAYLAQEATYALESEFGLPVTRIPYTLDIPSFLGTAKLDSEGNDMLGTRNAHHWRRVRYSYMDCRREANRRGLTIRGPRKIWDSSLAHLGFLYAQATGDARRYHDLIYERFWRRELDIEAVEVIIGVLIESGIDARDFTHYVTETGNHTLVELQHAAETAGVFGVPSWHVEGELFWGSERLDRIREKLRG
ncbi:MAG: DsbA family protein [Gammaproteobacteria bacterium]|nr:DsbA family protein [Gammaproteobacteria bacterium]